jgi:hypothetical protein
LGKTVGDCPGSIENGIVFGAEHKIAGFRSHSIKRLLTICRPKEGLAAPVADGCGKFFVPVVAATVK